MSGLAGLAARLREEGGLLAAAVADSDDATPHADAVPPTHAVLFEAIREGYLLHYAAGRVVRTEDRDLALLAGDRLYALGLARLAELGDLDGIAVLADLISDCARAHAEGDPARAERAWADGAARLAG